MQKLGFTLECEFENEGVRLLRYVMDRARYFKKYTAVVGIPMMRQVHVQR